MKIIIGFMEKLLTNTLAFGVNVRRHEIRLKMKKFMFKPASDIDSMGIELWKQNTVPLFTDM